jgi:hypothetical protein
LHFNSKFQHFNFRITEMKSIFDTHIHKKILSFIEQFFIEFQEFQNQSKQIPGMTYKTILFLIPKKLDF